MGLLRPLSFMWVFAGRMISIPLGPHLLIGRGLSGF